MSIRWTPDMEQMLEALWKTGQAASVIARVLSKEFGPMTRNAVLGRAHRRGLDSRRGQQRRPRADVVVRIVREKKIEAAKQILIAEMVPTPLLDATPFQCRFILDGYDDHDPHVCGAKGRPWCGFHRAQVFQPTSKKTLAPTVNVEPSALRA